MKYRIPTTLLAATLAACGAAPAARATTAPAPAAPTSTASSPSSPLVPVQSTPHQVAWGASRVTPGCFYFSGPPTAFAAARETLQGPVRMERRGADVWLFIGEAQFHGPDGVLRRTTTYEYGGEKWHVEETIAMSQEQEPGTYHYAECSEREGYPCESRCVIDTPITLTPE